MPLLQAAASLDPGLTARHIVLLSHSSLADATTSLHAAQKYAQRVSATFEFISDASSIIPQEVLQAWASRSSPLSTDATTLQSFLAAGSALRAHESREQLLVLDTSVFIKDDAPDIFAQCTGAVVCAYSEGDHPDAEPFHAHWRNSATWLRSRGFDALPQHFISTVPVVWGREALKSFLSVQTITQAIRYGVCSGMRPGQEYVAWAAWHNASFLSATANHTPWKTLPEGWNFAYGVNVLSRGVRIWDDNGSHRQMLRALTNQSIHFVRASVDNMTRYNVWTHLQDSTRLLAQVSSRVRDRAFEAQFGAISHPNCGRNVRLRDPYASLQWPVVPYPVVESEIVSDESDGFFSRCFVVQGPWLTVKTPMPVLFFFHGMGDGANGCGWRDDHSMDPDLINKPGMNLAEMAYSKGVALVCIESVAYEGRDIGAVTGRYQEKEYFWSTPTQMSEAGGTPCADQDSRDIKYIQSVLTWLDQHPDRFDTSNLFFGGESVGALAATYLATCLHARTDLPWNATALFTHSSGIKLSGDGIPMHPTPRMPWFEYGECPGCDFFPVVLSAHHPPPPMKLCVFDSYADMISTELGVIPFYETSVQLEKLWGESGGTVEMHMAENLGHVQVQSWRRVLECLDHHTHKLLRPDVNVALPGARISL